MKAFDTVPHRRLLKKLHGYQIQGKVHAWIKELLTGRHQRVVVNNIQSDEESVLSGVPQGSVLGPVLFLIFINDLPDTIDASVRIFADDTKIYSKIENRNDQNKLQENLSRLEQWAHTWQMRFHPQKCKVLHIGKDIDDFSYTMTTKDGLVELEFTS